MCACTNLDPFSQVTMPKPTEQMKYFFKDIVEVQERNVEGVSVKKWTGVCKFCTHRVSDALGTTSNFNRHCKNHEKELKEFEQKKPKSISTQPTLLQSFEKQMKYGRNDARQIKISESYIKNVVVKCGAPIYMVEQEGFRAFMNDVDPKWIPCGGKWVSQTKIPQMFASVKEKLISRLSQVANVSATLDIWTDRKMRAFMGMTVHYLDDNFQMQSQCLGVERMKGSHTGDAIYDKGGSQDLLNRFQKFSVWLLPPCLLKEYSL